MSLNFEVFEDIVVDLNSFIKKAEDLIKILEIGAKSFVKDLKKLTSPYSKIRRSGYTHLIDTFCYEIEKNEIKVGWGKYYGRMVEEGTVLINAQPHLRPTFENNKIKYYEEMKEYFYK